MTSDAAPTPRLNLPGAASARAAALIASSAGPRVNTPAIAVPRCAPGSTAEA
jgi:hypothetical protein